MNPPQAQWKPVTAAGQVRVGDKLRFTIGDKPYSERAKLILHAGTDKEEVIYDRRNNFYFITSMILSGGSNHKNLKFCARAGLILPAAVQRDESGFWTHPGLPEFDEGDAAAFRAWRDAQRLEMKCACLDSEDDDHPAYVAYFENEAASCAGWEPPCPSGGGWFVLAIEDTEDGPQCWWARRV